MMNEYDWVVVSRTLKENEADCGDAQEKATLEHDLDGHGIE